jgi:hypothetical protein
MQAVVEDIKSAPLPSGKGFRYSVKLNGQYISAGFKAPGCNVGDTIEYNTVQNGQYTNLGSIQVLSQGGASASAPNSGAVSSAQPAGKRERSIVRQNSLSHAVVTMNTFLDSVRSSSGVEAKNYTNAVDLAQDTLLVARVYELYSMQDMDDDALNEKLEQLLGSTAE